MIQSPMTTVSNFNQTRHLAASLADADYTNHHVIEEQNEEDDDRRTVTPGVGSNRSGVALSGGDRKSSRGSQQANVKNLKTNASFGVEYKGMSTVMQQSNKNINLQLTTDQQNRTQQLPFVKNRQPYEGG